MSGSHGHSALHGTLWMLAGYISRMAVQAAYVVIIARTLGPSSYGVFAGVIAFLSILAPFAAWGMGTVIIRESVIEPNRFGQVYGNALKIHALSFVGLGVVAYAINEFLVQADLPALALLLIAGSELVFFPMVTIAAQSFQGLNKLRMTAVIYVLSSIFRLAAALSFILVPGNMDLMAWSLYYAIATLTSAVVATLLLVNSGGAPKFTSKISWVDLKRGGYYSVGQSAKSIYADIDKTILLRLAGPEIAGLYSAGHRFAIMAFVPLQALLGALYARLFRAHHQGHGALYLLMRKLTPPMLIYSVLAALALYFGAPLIPLVLGDDYADSIQVIQILAFIPLVQSLSYVLADALTASDMQGWRSIAQVVGAVVSIGLNLFFVPTLGWRGAALSIYLSQCLIILSLAIVLGHHFNRTTRRML